METTAANIFIAGSTGDAKTTSAATLKLQMAEATQVRTIEVEDLGEVHLRVEKVDRP